jgi:hypothetical protein
MSPGVLADAVVAIHFAFVAFAVAGGLLVLRHPRWVWLHLPALAWAAWVELAGWVCPLTPLENELRRAAGESGYAGGFVEHYLVPVLYPEGLTRAAQIALGTGLLALNAALYTALLLRRRRPGAAAR